MRCLSRRCRRCAVSEKCTPIDATSLCDLCKNYNPATIETDEKKIEPKDIKNQFEKSIRSACGCGGKYDAGILLSGGKDSAYILCRLRKEFPDLKLLGIVVDNGFMSQVAMNNVKQTSTVLNTDVLVVRSKVGQFASLFREAFLSLNGRPGYSVVDKADGSNIFNVGLNILADINIPIMFSGMSWVQLEHIAGLENTFEQVMPNGIRQIFPLAVWRENEQKIRSIVLDQGLIPAGNESPLVTNNELILPMCVIDILQLGYCGFEPEFSQLVREGKSDLKIWRNIFELLEYGVRTGYLIKETNRRLSQLNLTVNDILKRG